VLSYHRSSDTDVRTTVRTHAWHVAGLAATFVVVSAPGVWTRSHGRLPSYLPATIALVLLLIVITTSWRRLAWDAPTTNVPRWLPIAVAAAGCLIAGAGAWYWVGQILANPIDPNHADMLPVIDAVLRRALKWQDPYSIYHIPWEAPLGYGPVLWVPFFVPHFLHADLRIVTVFGALAVPAWCAVAAVAGAMRRRVVEASMWLALTATILFNPDLTGFMPVGHTPSYWPLLPLFAMLATTERWTAAAFLLGLIVVGRSTMVAGLPIFFMAVWVVDRAKVWRAMAASLAPVLVLIFPFAIWDPHALWYGMIAVYPAVIKNVVWSVPDGAIAHTIGITGWLVAHHLERFVEATQACAVVGVWIAAWFAIRRGARPLPWMGLAVLAFCMTTLWPLYYIYFDVLMFFIAAAIAETLVAATVRVRTRTWLCSLAVVAGVVTLSVRIAAPSYPRIDFESADSRKWLYQGFANSRAAGEPSLPWIWGYDATIALPRGSTAAATIVVFANPVVPQGGPAQQVTAFLNGRPLGTVDAGRGWQSLRFAAPSGAWLIGANALKLVCATATSPILIGMSDDPRHLSLALRRIDVVPDTDGNRR
jgi:hypothetical protein